MKNYLVKTFFALLLSCIITNVFSQRSIGYNIGLSLNKIELERTVATSYFFMPGASFGVTQLFLLEKKINIQAEFLINTKGYRVQNFTGKENFNSVFFSAPILAKFNLTKKWNILLGTEFSYLLLHRTKLLWLPQDNVFIASTIEDSFATNLEVGATAGIGYLINEKLLLNLRYTKTAFPKALIDITPLELFSFEQFNYKNLSFQLMAIFLLD